MRRKQSPVSLEDKYYAIQRFEYKESNQQQSKKMNLNSCAPSSFS